MPTNLDFFSKLFNQQKDLGLFALWRMESSFTKFCFNYLEQKHPDKQWIWLSIPFNEKQIENFIEEIRLGLFYEKYRDQVLVIDRFEDLLQKHPHHVQYLNTKRDVFGRQRISVIFCIGTKPDSLRKFAKYCGDVFSFISGNILKLESQDKEFLNGLNLDKKTEKFGLVESMQSSSLQWLKKDKAKLEAELQKYLKNSQDPSYQFSSSGLEYLLNIFYSLGKYPEAVDFIKTYLLPKLDNFSNKTKARFRISYADFLQASGQYQTALTELDKAEKYLTQADELKAEYLAVRANVYIYQGKYPEAEEMHKQALKIRQEKLPENHPDIAQSLNNLAGVYIYQGKYPEAEELFKQALEIARKTIGQEHPIYAKNLNNLAGVYESQGKYPEAEELYEQALEIGKKTIGENHPDYAIHLNNLALVYNSQGKYPEAEELYKQALEIDKKTIGEGHPNYAIRLNNLGVLYYLWSKNPPRQPTAATPQEGNLLQLAQTNLQQALEIRLAKLGEGHPDTQGTQKWLDDVNSELGVINGEW